MSDMGRCLEGKSVKHHDSDIIDNLLAMTLIMLGAPRKATKPYSISVSWVLARAKNVTACSGPRPTGSAGLGSHAVDLHLKIAK